MPEAAESPESGPRESVVPETPSQSPETNRRDARGAPEPSLRTILLDKWIPALLTAVVGGLFVAWLVPQAQTHYAEEAAFKKRQIEVWESVGTNFTNFVLAYSRLNTAARQETEVLRKGSVVDALFVQRKEGYVQDRDKFFNLLRHDFLLVPYYFSNERVSKTIGDYLEWQRQYRQATFDTLPPDSALYEWRDRIMAEMRLHLKGSSK
jgi:hypothetical protein